MEREDAEKKIESALARVHPKRLESNVVKTKRLTFKMHDTEFEEIQQTAEALGMSIADYFCALHRYAVKRLDVTIAEGDWVHRKSRNRAKQE